MGSSAQSWDFGGLIVNLTKYPALQRQARHRHENPTYFFLLGGEFTDESSQLGTQSPERFELLYHPSGAWHQGTSGPSGRVGLNIEPNQTWLRKFDLDFDDLGGYRIEADPIRSSELLRLATGHFYGSAMEDQILEILLPNQEFPDEQPSWCQKLQRKVNCESIESLTLRSLAEELSVHPVYLARVFRSRYRCTVTEWIRRKRLLIGAKALLDGVPISEVALDAGFSDHSHFGRVFKSYFSYSPREFRRHWNN